MRWKLLRRRLSVSAPRMIVRSHLPWPLRWAVAAVVLGFSAAIALWAFEFGKNIAGLDKDAKEELARLRDEVSGLKSQYARSRQIADTSESLLKAERAAQEKLAQQLRQLEAEKQALQADLGFFERLLPSTGEGLQVRGLQAEVMAPGQLRYQMLVVQNGKVTADFRGRFELTVAGTLDGKPFSQALPGGAKPLQLRLYTRVEGMVDLPPAAVIKTVQIRVIDSQGARPDHAVREARFLKAIPGVNSMLGMGSKKKLPPIRSLICEGTVVKGHVHFVEGLRIDGEVQGDITCEEPRSILVISENARVAGMVKAGHVIINGEVRGPIHAIELLELQPKARVFGEMRYELLEMHQGAQVDGELRPLKSAEKPALKLAASNDA